jgi:hypothetical protein
MLCVLIVWIGGMMTMLSREHWDVLWGLMGACQRLGVVGERLGGEPTVGGFVEAYDARQQALARFLKVWCGGEV